MPYIKQEERAKFDDLIDRLILRACVDERKNTSNIAGNLNYIITRLLTGTYDLADGPRYVNLNEAVGVLECTKLELYRRRAAPYEDKKSEENGDVK